MKAARINEYGGPSVVNIEETDIPQAGDGQVLVEVHAASLNPFDTTVREGYVDGLTLPLTLGGDIAGVIVEMGEGVTNVSVGDSVYGQANVVAGNSGAFAEFAATAAGQVASAPSSISLSDAASLPLVGSSAIQALTRHIGLVRGQKLFIHGGAGGIGSIAIQLAKHIGAYIATTATGEDVDYVKGLGADEVIDYKTQDFAEVLNGYDAVFDTVGRDDFVRSYGILKPGGIAVSMIAPADETKASELGITAMMQFTSVTTEVLDTLSGLVDQGVVSPRIGSVMPLAQIKEAFEARESATVKGKIVLRVKAD